MMLSPSQKHEIHAKRTELLGRNLSLSYTSNSSTPLLILRGQGQYLYDENNREYLDCVNNVAHVGHCHPRVVKAASAQMALLNTNTRYLHPSIVEYATKLTSTLPAPLSVCFFVCSGSEANDLALRLARTHTKKHDVLVLDGAYHGHLSSMVEISPYKYLGKGGFHQKEHVHKCMVPDTYRGKFKSSDEKAGERYAEDVAAKIKEAHLNGTGRGIAAFFAESVLGCAGQIVLPPGYLKAVYEHVRGVHAVCIADEVQVGFGRVGSKFWGFETQGVIPDIVTMGKPIGNGFPMAAVVTTPEIADSFANGMEYFNTFGGCTAACAVGIAVIDVIKEEKLQENAHQTGAYLLQLLEDLRQRHHLIGDVRGIGLFLGIELVKNRDTLEPAAKEASLVATRMKDLGILISTDGPWHNVLKLKPPICFNAQNAQHFACTLDSVLSEVSAKQASHFFTE